METFSLRSQPIWAYLQLMRPANILTAWADILVGYAAAECITVNADAGFLTFNSFSSLGWLVLSTSGLYGGGVVFNDVFDLELDRQERPERPLPSDRASFTNAVVLGSLLLIVGVLAASQVSLLSGGIAFVVALTALIYDGFGKHQVWLSPINMGLCRGGNWLLGVSVLPVMVTERWFLALIPIIYISAVTAISRGEVEGGSRQTGIFAISLILLGLISVFALGFLENYSWYFIVPFVILFALLVLPAFVKATLNPDPLLIQKAVKAGVLSLIVLDSAIAAGFAGFSYGLIVLSLLPLSVLLARLFAVT